MAPHRRDLMRLIGGGVVLAALPAGCAAAIDPRAPWDHPGAGEGDPRRRALAFALLAPNPHNMQPWMADLSQPGVVTLHADPERLLPATDPFNRQIVIGCGAFLELMRLAAAQDGHEAVIDVFPEGEAEPRLDRRPFARIAFRPGGAPDPLFAHVLSRRTTRQPFDRRPVPAAAAARLVGASLAGVRAQAATDPARLSELRAIAYEGARIEAFTPAAQAESCGLTFIGREAVAAHRYGISLEGPAIELAHAAGLLTQAQLARPGSWAFDQSLDLMRRMADTAQGFIWLTTDQNRRADQIAAGRAYLRLNTQAAAEGLAMHPWSQALQEYSTMAGLYRRIHQTLAPQGGRVQMFVRIGYARPVPPAPRRGLEAQILKARAA